MKKMMKAVFALVFGATMFVGSSAQAATVRYNGFDITYSGTCATSETGGDLVMQFTSNGSLELPTGTTADGWVLVVGGGASGTKSGRNSRYGGSGGGGKAAENKSLALKAGVTYSITVGAAQTTTSTDGNPSSFSGSGITTLTGNGGTASTTTQQRNNGIAGTGGYNTANSITGSSVTYGQNGAAATSSNYNKPGTGIGGGGVGGYDSGNGGNGTAGIVIVRISNLVVPKEKVTLDPVTVRAGKTVTVSADCEDSNVVSEKSDDETIATVSGSAIADGKLSIPVTGVYPGNANIAVETDDHIYTLAVTVNGFAPLPQPEETADSKMHLAYVDGHADQAVIRNYYFGTGGSDGYQFNFRNNVTGTGVSATTTTTGSIADGSTGLTTVTATDATGAGKVTIQRAKYKQPNMSDIGTYKDDCIYNTASRVQRVVYVGKTATAYGVFSISINDTAETGTTGSWKTPTVANGLVTAENVAGVSFEHNFVSVTGVNVGWEQVTSEFMTDSPHNPPQPEGVTYTFNFQVRDTPAVFGTIPDQQINFNTKLSTIDLNTLGIVMKDSNGTVVAGEFVWDNPDKTWNARETTVETAVFTATGTNAEFYDPVAVDVTIVAGEPKVPSDGTFGDSILVTTGTRELTDVPFVWTSWKVVGDDIGVTVEADATSGNPVVKAGAQAGKTVIWIESDDYYRVYEVKVYEAKTIDVEGYKNSTKRVKLTSAAEAVWAAHSDDESIATVTMGSSEASANAEATVVCKGDDGDTVSLTVQNDYVVYTVNVTVKGEKQPEIGKFNLAAGETAVMSLCYGGNSPAERCFRVTKTEDGISVNRDYAENKNQKTLNLTFTGLQDDGTATVEIQQKQSYDSGNFAAYTGNYISEAVAQPKRIMYLGETKQLYCLSSEAAAWTVVPADDGIVSVTAPSGAVAEGNAQVTGNKVGTTTFTIGNTAETSSGSGFFKGVTYTINYEVRGMPMADGDLTGDKELETGALLSTIGVAGAMTNALGEAVGGTFAWVNGNQTFDTEGTETVEAIFTPANPSYDSVKVEVLVTVSRPCVKVPTAKLGLVYDGTGKTGVVATEGCVVTGNVATNAGTYTATATLTGDLAWPDGSKDPTNITWTIARKSVTVTANATNKVYGATEPELTATVTGLVNGESEDLITYTLSRENGDDVGTYDIFVMVNEADQGNYRVSGDTATDAFEITRAPIAKPTAVTTLVYNGGCVTGVVANTGFTVADNFATNAGTYTAKATLDGNHKWADDSTDAADVEFTIAPAEIAVTADDKTVKENDPAPEYTYTVTPELFGDDKLEGTLVCAYDPKAAKVGDTFDILQGSLTNANYTITSFTKGTLTVASLQVTLEPAGRTYDGTAFPSNSITFTVTDNDGTTITDFSVAGTNSMLDAGTYTFKVTTANGLEGSANFVVSQALVTVTAVSTNKVYDAVEPDLTATVAGTFGGDTVSYEVTRAEGEDASEYKITASGDASQGNYKVTFVPGTFTIFPKGITVKANDATKTYGDPDPDQSAYSATITGTNGTDGATFTFTYSPESGAVDVKDDYTLNVTGVITQGNYYVESFVSGKFSITPKLVTVTPVATNKVYSGDAATDPALAATVAGTNGTDGATIDYEVTRADGENVGQYLMTVTVDQEIQGNYKVTTNTTPVYFTITPKPVTVAAVATNKVYSSADPDFTATVTGTIGSDTVSYTVGRTNTCENVGTYDIVPTGAAEQGNYTVTYEKADFTITPKPVTVKADDDEKTYGDDDPTTFAATVTGTNGTDGATIVYTISRTEGDVATNDTPYVITPTGDEEQGNYTVTFETGTFTINRKAVTVTADDKTKVFGDLDPELTATVPGLVGDDTVDYTVSRTNDCEDVGTYDIVPTGAEEQGNYTVSYAAGTLTIERRPILITVVETNKVYGAKDPDFTYVVSNAEGTAELKVLPNGNGIVLNGYLVRTPGEDVKDSPYDVDTLTFFNETNNPNYVFEATLDGENKFTILPAPLTVTADDKTKVYGTAEDPELTATVTGLKRGDTEASLGLVYSLDRATGEGAGTYAITPTGTTPQGGEYGKNYDIAYSNGTFTITKATLTVTPKDATVAFGATPAYGYSLSGFKRGDTDATVTVTGEPSYSCTYEGVGTYPISITAVDAMSSDNYTFAADSATATLTVTKSEDPLIPEGGDEPGSGAVPEGGKSKFDLFKMYDGEGFTLDCAAISNAYATMTLGAYSVTSASAPVTNAGTYTVSYTVTSENYPDYTHEAQLTVTNRPVTLTSADGNFAYDGQAHSNTTVTVGGAGFVAGEGVTTNDFATITVKGSRPNSFDYELVLNKSYGSIPANYLVTCVTGTLTVAAAVNSWAVVPSVTSKTYDGQPAYTSGAPTHGTAVVTFDGGQTTAPVDAGSHTATFTVAGTADWTGLTTNIAYTITKATLTVTPKDTTVAFGEEPAYDFALTGFADGEDATGAGVSGNPTYACEYVKGVKGVGGYDIAIATVGDLAAANYTFAADSATATLTVTKSEDPLIPEGGDEPGSGAVPEGGKSKFDLFKMYDGEGFTLDCAAISNAYATMTLGAYSVTSASAPVTNAGTYKVSYTVTSENYPDYTHEAQLTVTNRPVTLTSADGSFTFDGEAHSNTTVTVGGAGFVAGEGVTTNNFATITEKGSCDNSFDYELVLNKGYGSIPANYLVTCVTGTLTVAGAVNGWTVVPTVTPKTYDRQPAEYTLGTPAFGTVTVTFDGGQTKDPVDAGSHTATFTVAATEDYTALSTNIAYTISAKALTVDMAEEIPAQRWAHGYEVRPTVTLSDGTLMTAGDYEITGYSANTAPGTGKVIVEGRGNYTGTIEVPFTILTIEETSILETFEHYAEIAYDDQEEILRIKLTNDMEGAVELFDNLGDVVIDLNNHSIRGKNGADEKAGEPATNGEPAIRIVSAKEAGSEEHGDATTLSVVDESGEPADSGLKGGNGGTGDEGPGGNGGAGVEVDSNALPGVEVAIDDGVSAEGGNGGAGNPPGESGLVIDDPKIDLTSTIDVDDADAGVEEGSNLVIRVTGGNPAFSSSVQLQVVYGTATSSDLDLKNALVNGAVETSFKFPYTFTWDAGEVGEQTVEIPVKKQSKAKNTRDLTFELQNPQNLVLRGVDSKSANRSYRKVKILGVLGLVTDKVYVRAVPNDATRGKTSGSALVVPGKKVTVKATANKGFAFTGWEGLGSLEGLDSRSASISFSAPTNDVDLVARFEPLAADYLKLTDDFLPAELKFGEVFSNAVTVASGSLPTITVSGLPAGLKYYAKETLVKATSKTPAYTVPANTIYGIPTKASATNKTSGVVTPSKVKVTVKNLGGYKVVRTYELRVTARTTGLAAVIADEKPYATVSVALSDDAAGKVTGAGLYQAGKKVTLKATANKGYVFAEWLEKGVNVSSNASYVIASMPSNSVSLVAKFVLPDEIKDPTGKAPYGVAVVRNNDFAGNVTGAGYYQVGKKVTLKATALKGYVFSEWTTEDGVRLTQDASLVIAKMPAKNLRYVAVFVTAAADLGSIETAVNGMALTPGSGKDSASPLPTNVMCGVTLQWPVVSTALSLPKVAVSGLPSGLKFTAKPVTAKVNGVTVTNVPANTIYGAPTAASSIDKATNQPKPSKVKVTVTTSGKSKAEYQIDLVVNPLPDYAVGTFDGPVFAADGTTNGVVKLTVAKNGKISGTIQTNCLGAAAKKLTLSVASFADYDLVTGDFKLVPTYKDGKETVEVPLTLADSGAVVGEKKVGVVDGESLFAYQNVLKGAAADAFIAPTLFDGLTATVAKDGVLKIAGKVTDNSGNPISASGSSQIYYDADEAGYRAVIYLPSKKGFDGVAEIIEVDPKTE